MSGWRIKYTPAGTKAQISTDEMDTLELALRRAVNRGWRRNAGRIDAIEGPNRLIEGAELDTLLDDAEARYGE
jgi:hypothetical protein